MSVRMGEIDAVRRDDAVLRRATIS